MQEVCPTCGRKKTRSSESNRRYWALLTEISDRLRPEGVQHSAKIWHIYFRQRFLGMLDITLPNGKTLSEPVSTSELDTASFNDYMTQVEVWAADHNVYLPE
jgi:hypothetical protein